MNTFTLLTELDYNDLWILTTYLDHRDETVLPSLPLADDGGLVSVSILLAEAEGPLRQIVEQIETAQLKRREVATLQQLAESLHDALAPQRPDYSESLQSRLHMLQGTLESRFIKGRGPYAYLRFWATGGGKSRTKRKHQSVYLGAVFGMFVHTLRRGSVDDELRRLIEKAIVWAYWSREYHQTRELTQLEWACARLGWFLNEDIFFILLEQHLQPMLSDFDPRASQQNRVRAIYEKLCELPQDKETIDQAKTEWMRQQGTFSPALPQTEADIDIAFTPMLGSRVKLLTRNDNEEETS